MAKTIPQLTDATTVNAADELIVHQGGITKRATRNELMTFAPTGASQARLIDDRLTDFVSVKDFGATGDGITDDADAIQNALNSGLGNIYMPSGIYSVSKTLVVRGNTSVVGAGRGVTTITMPDTVGRRTSVVWLGDPEANTHEENIRFEGITVDFNFNRWTVTGGTVSPYGAMNENAITVTSSKYVYIKDCAFIDGFRHSMDITTRIRKSSQGNSPQGYLDMPIYPDALIPQYVWVENCYFRGGGDDNWTCHYCSDIFVTECHSEFPKGARGSVLFAAPTQPPNSNGYEIDDGSRNVTLTNCVAVGCNQGIEIKAHHYAPAPYNVTIDNVRIINCCSPVEIHHTHWVGVDNNSNSAYTKLNIAALAADPAFTGVILAQGTPYEVVTIDGSSPMASNVQVSNVQIIAPCENTFIYQNGSETNLTSYVAPSRRCFEISGYKNVVVSNLQFSDGVGNLGNPDDGYRPATLVTNGYLIHLHRNARNFSFYNTHVSGCAAIVETLFRLISTVRDKFIIDGVVSTDGPERLIYSTGANAPVSGIITNVSVHNKAGVSYLNPAIEAANGKMQIGTVDITGYTQDVSSPAARTISNTGSPEGVVYAGRGSLYLRRDATGASDAIYVKTTDTDLNTGWVAK